MANHKSSIKRIKRNEKRKFINKIAISKMRTVQKKVTKLIETKDKKSAEAFKEAMSLIAKLKSSGKIHKKAASRKTSRLAKKLATISK